MTAYYLVTLNRCGKCDKPTSHEVQGTGNVSYGKFCKKHAEQHLKYLRGKDKPKKGWGSVGPLGESLNEG